MTTQQNQHWIINHIKYSQLHYANISKTPLDVLKHLLFCNGNGHEMQNGNLFKYFDHGLNVPYSVFYKEMWSFQKMKDYYLDYGEYLFDEEFERLKDLYQMRSTILSSEKISDDALWKEARQNVRGQWNGMDLVENYTIDDLKKPTTYLKMLDNAEYMPYLRLSNGYFKADFFTPETDRDLVEVTYAIADALITRMQHHLDTDDFSGKDTMFGFDWDNKGSQSEAERYKAVYPKDIEILTELKHHLIKLSE